ncbi:MAG: dUTPase [Candidatus Magasanikbacteria bacterium RIFOXYD2_FULL_39_9]|uniref:dUTP diphosphatase n=1 Tax=Candidatus Magasanikbacteria bacterium RIFOXYD1_FULL_40_23 TaxID=1798705 RepID=A0A1F6P8Z5_9BACT|nr:MAG: dUTPase [Candidatus Magasanikbacteria bacterium RIFOXYD2_FULL_39_9]OGH92655.1 MAG: dUTPase [Candidatus Magasanikbacteria bacterium RIFOXYD1_FULL_40_23]
MKVKIKRIDTSLPLPEYQTSGAVAFDLYSRVDMTIAPKSLGLIPTNIIVEIPKGYMLILASRSSTPKKKGLLVPHGIGIIDQDYCGEKDELLLQVYNFTDQEVPVARGERMGQAVFVRIDQGEWEEVTEMTEKNRGGFGTTGQI